jgi:hypothetical protein
LFHIGFGSSTDIYPQIIESRDRRACATALQVSAFYDHNAGTRARSRKYPDSLAFMKLHPERMLSSGAHFTQSQVTIVSDFSHGKGGTIECASDDTPRVSTAFTQDQITQLIALPVGKCSNDYVGCEIFTTRRSVKIYPGSHNWRAIGAILRY